MIKFLEGTVVAYLNSLSYYFPGDTEDNHDRSQSRYPVTSEVQVYKFTTTPTCLVSEWNTKSYVFLIVCWFLCGLPFIMKTYTRNTRYRKHCLCSQRFEVERNLSSRYFLHAAAIQFCAPARVSFFTFHI